ncbi:type II toxin-antitoxin system Phd/YefM family antitoxin [Zavarzinella formosa]|uniref:type II toxin-antitoxin system Phd/YefM family antitoxin n=1 Tax=Zavarzinella formosa TaxID=360055 RepID=UPI0002D8C01D|nr:hypothetical protein [Zavarzinella formosa]
MTTLSVQEFQALMPTVLDDLKPGEEIVITRDEKPLARVLGGPKPTRQPRRPGNCAGMMVVVSDDDEYLKDFAEHLN